MRFFLGTTAEFKEVAHLLTENPIAQAREPARESNVDAVEGEVQASPEVVERALTRIPLSKNQRAVLKAVVEASPGWISTVELAGATGLTRQELSGVWGALGRRVANTEGWPPNGQAIESDWDHDNSLWRYRALSALCEIVKAGRVKF
jgi:hypothetical protein